jgi:acyl-CoA reductase-like NAD-dependent aldehyde dehydrogenase
MATVAEQQTHKQDGRADTIEVLNPATGELLQTLAACTPERLQEMALRGREAQPGWQALGFGGRRALLPRAQKWMLDNSERVLDTVVPESGKTREDVVL